eukprot:14263952-Heterocapsa_arctica.AAC.1
MENGRRRSANEGKTMYRLKDTYPDTHPWKSRRRNAKGDVQVDKVEIWGAQGGAYQGKTPQKCVQYASIPSAQSKRINRDRRN